MQNSVYNISAKHTIIVPFLIISSIFTTSINKLVQMDRAKIGLPPYLDKFLMTSNFCGTLTEKPTLDRFLDSII